MLGVWRNDCYKLWPGKMFLLDSAINVSDDNLIARRRYHSCVETTRKYG